MASVSALQELADNLPSVPPANPNDPVVQNFQQAQAAQQSLLANNGQLANNNSTPSVVQPSGQVAQADASGALSQTQQASTPPPQTSAPLPTNDPLAGIDLDKMSLPLDQVQGKTQKAPQPNNILGGIDLDKVADGDIAGSGLKTTPAPQTLKAPPFLQASPQPDQSGSMMGGIGQTIKGLAGKYGAPAAAGAIEGAGGVTDSIIRPLISLPYVGYQMANGKSFKQAIETPLSPVSNNITTPLANLVSPQSQQTNSQNDIRAGVSGAVGGKLFGVPGAGALASLAQEYARQNGASPLERLGISMLAGSAPSALNKLAGSTGLQNFTRAGQEASVGSRLRTLAQNPDEAAAAMTAKSPTGDLTNASPIEGYQRTAAVASQDPGLLATQKRLEQMNPAAFATLNNENNAALNRAVESEAGTPATLQNAIDERENTTGPMREQAFANYNNDPRLPSTQYQNFKSDVQDEFDNISDVDINTKAGQKQINGLLENYGYNITSKASNSGKSSVFTASKVDPVTNDPVSFQYRTGANPLPASAFRTSDYLDLANPEEGLDALAAKVARSEPTKPAVNLNYPQGVINRTMQSPQGNTPQVQKAMTAASNTLGNAVKNSDPSTLGDEVNPEYAYPLKKAMQSNAQDLLDPTGMNPGAKRMAGGLLKPVMNSLDNQINNAAPGYADYLAKYHEMSKPIEQMDMLQEASQSSRSPSISGTPSLQAGKWNQYFTKNMNDAKNTLTPSQMQMVVQVGDELDKGASMDQVAPVSKNDVSNLTTGNLLGYLSNGTVRAAATIGSMAHSGGIWGAAVGGAMKGLKFVADMPENSARELLLEASKDPELAGRLMQNPTAINLSETTNKLGNLAKQMGYGAFVGAATTGNNAGNQK